jgi:hypothetical protein
VGTLQPVGCDGPVSCLMPATCCVAPFVDQPMCTALLALNDTSRGSSELPSDGGGRCRKASEWKLVCGLLCTVQCTTGG